MEYYLADERIGNTSYGDWTGLWWKWALSIPKDRNPVSDITGKYADTNQPKGVWYLAGIWADEFTEFPIRTSTIPRDVSILIPVLNCEADVIEYPDIKTDQDILDHVSNQVDKIVKKECHINDELVPPMRIRSDPIIFEVDIDPSFDKYKGIGGRVRASSDGYWVFLKPLPEGTYEIVFEGWYEFGRLKSGATYHITVV